MNNSENPPTPTPTTISIILRELQSARYDGLAIHDLAEAVYGPIIPRTALPLIRGQIYRHNARGDSPRIIRHSYTSAKRSLYYIAGFQPSMAVTRDPMLRIPPADRIAARFAPGCQPRFGK